MHFCRTLAELRRGRIRSSFFHESLIKRLDERRRVRLVESEDCRCKFALRDFFAAFVGRVSGDWA